MVWVVQMARAMFDRCALVVHRPLAEGQKEAVSEWGWPDVLESWSWPGQEGRPLAVHAYADAAVRAPAAEWSRDRHENRGVAPCDTRPNSVCLTSQVIESASRRREGPTARGDRVAIGRRTDTTQPERR
jgi:hypothetical protein